MYYHHYIKVKTNLNKLKLNLKEINRFRLFLEDFVKKSEFNFNIIDNSFKIYTESNGCFSFEFKSFNDNQESLVDFYNKNILNIFSETISFEKYNIVLDKKDSLTTCYTNIDSLLVFENISIEPIIKSLNEIPDKTYYIEFNGLYPKSSNERLQIFVEFKDIDNNVLETPKSIENSFNFTENTKKYFNSDSQFGLKIKHLKKLLLGDSNNFLNNYIFTTKKYNNELSDETRIYFDFD